MTTKTANMTMDLTTATDGENVMENTTAVTSPDCGDPGGVTGAGRVVVGEEWTVGSSVTYGCDQNYKHSQGNLTRYCQVTATWSGRPPVCTYVGAMVSPEVLGAVTGALAILVLLLLPIEFLRYRLKQAQGRRIMKSTKKSQRQMARQRPFMGTPVFSKNSDLLPGPVVNSKKASLQTNYSSNAETLPENLPRMPDGIDWEEELRRKPKRKKKKRYSDGSTVALCYTNGSSPMSAKVNPLTGNGDVTTSDDVTTWRRPTEGCAVKEVNGGDRLLSSDYFRSPKGQRAGYENPVSLEDELQQNVFSLGTHKLPPLSQAPSSLVTQNSPQEVELQDRDMRDFVV